MIIQKFKTYLVMVGCRETCSMVWAAAAATGTRDVKIFSKNREGVGS